MLPLSLVRTASAGASRVETRRAFSWMRPANNSSKSLVERRAAAVWMGVVAALAVGIGLAHVWLRLQVVNVGYQLSATREVIARLQQEENELALEVAGLDVPARLEALARERLGMIRPERGQEAMLP
jgi:cell division protein FtsL